MFYRELFRRDSTSGLLQYEDEIQYALGLPGVWLQRDALRYDALISRLRGMDICDGASFYDSDVLGYKLPEHVDAILSVQENFICYMCLSAQGTLVLQDDIYADWVMICDGMVQRIHNPLRGCLCSIADVVTKLSLDTRRLALECSLNDNVELVGGPVISSRVRIGKSGQLRGLKTLIGGGISVDPKYLDTLNHQLYDVFRYTVKCSDDSGEFDKQHFLCESCNAPLDRHGSCPFCNLANNKL